MTAGRTNIGIIAGITSAGAVIALVEVVAHRNLQGELPFAAAVVGYGLGALVGTYATTKFAGRWSAIAVPAMLAGLATVNLFSFPHPVWFAPGAIIALALGWSVGSAFGGRGSSHETAKGVDR